MDDVRKLNALFQTLADYNRLQIIKIIGENECSVSEIVTSTGLSQPLISFHLRNLKENKFLETKRKGPFIYYSLRDKRIIKIIDLTLNIFKDFEPIIQSNSFCPPWMKKQNLNYRRK